MKLRTATALLCLLAASTAMPAVASTLGSSNVYLENMTWQEIKDHIHAGSDIVIVPIGGTEQNGPQMVTGRQNVVVRYTASEIAKKLGDALVAPVIPYAPSGRIDPPEGHMRFPGTISMSDDTFTHVLQDTAASLKANGFRLICFISESGGSEAIEREVAHRLTDEWQHSATRVLYVSNYYTHNGQDEWADSIGIKVMNPRAHAGLVDTSELMAIDAPGVRGDLRGVRTDKDYKTTGAMGDSSKANADYGRRFLSLKVNAAVAQIKNASGSAQ
jgi:creatinine amidohydrolase